jgi:hypothetical protein
VFHSSSVSFFAVLHLSGSSEQIVFRVLMPVFHFPADFQKMLIVSGFLEAFF